MIDVGEIFKLSFDSLKNNKVRSFLTMLGIIIGVASVILLVSIGSGLQKYITEQFEDLGSNLIMIMPGKVQFSDEAGREGGPPGVATNKLTVRIANKLKREGEYIKEVLPIVTKSLVTKYGNNSHSTGVVGSTENYASIRNSAVAEGRNLTKAEVSAGKRVTIIGQTLKDELFSEADPLGKKILLGDQRYTIVGVFESKGASFGQDQDDLALIPITAASRQFDLEKLSYIYVETYSAEDTARATSETKKILLKEMDEDDFTVYDSKDLLSTFSSILSFITAALGGIAGISLLVGGIGIMNIMLVSVTERTKEIGLRKAVGAKQSDISLQFLIEATFLSVAGGLIGIGLGFGSSLILNHFLKTAVTWWAIGISFGVSALVGIVFGFAPALRASKLDPIEALRHD